MDSTRPSEFKPPTIAFTSLSNFWDDLATRPLPPQIDRSMMGGKSGTGQRLLFVTLEQLGLIDAEHRVQPSLQAVATDDPDKRKAEVTNLLRRFYPEALSTSEADDTHQQLEKAFTDAYGPSDTDSRRKSITFFLHALGATDLHTSANFPKTRAGSGAPAAGRTRRTRPRRTPTAKTAAEETAAPAVATSSGEEKVIILGDAGHVTIQVAVKWLDLPDDVFMALRKAIRDLESLGSQDSAPPSAGAVNGQTLGERVS